jgi:hypothetical protein
MKNSEWGAVVYLTHSIYGKNSEVWINPYGDTSTWKMKTGYAGGSVSSNGLAEGNGSLAQYNTGNGPNASTTGNLYGVYDMSGGAWEFVAAYTDNGNIGLGDYGTNTYFTNNRLNAGFEKYYDIYEPGDQEKQGGQYYGTGIDTLWGGDNSVANNTIRKTLTDATYEKMINRKGDAIYETSNGVSYFGKNTNGNYIWLINAADTVQGFARSWNDDYQLRGHGNMPWVVRGGRFNNDTGSGTLALGADPGNISVYIGFRPVLVAGDTL